MYNYFIDFLFQNYMFTCKPKPTQQDLQQQRYKIEEELISRYNMRPSLDFQIFDVEVMWRDNQYTIHTFEGGDINKPTLVLFHGYGGSNVHYSKTYKDLCSQFRVIAIDLPGMGFSSKENILMETSEDAITYFNTMIELWRQKMNLKHFCLAGHSFGGYIAALYATHHPEIIDQLFLLSPAGTSHYTQEQVVEMNNFKHLSFLRRWALNHARDLWASQVTPQQIGKRIYGNCLIKGYLEKRMKLKGKELDIWKTYKEAMISLPEGSEKSIFMLFDFPKVIAKVSIQEMFEQQKDKLNFPVTFYYGSSDWMDSKGASELSELYPQIQVRFVADAGHQLTFENPKLLVEYIIQDFQIHLDLIQQLNYTVHPQDLQDDQGKEIQFIKQHHQFETDEIIMYDNQQVQRQE